jgi:hypothetical protein
MSSKPRFSLNDVEDEPEIPVAPMISRPVPVSDKREEEPEQVVDSGADRARQLAMERFKPMADKRQTTVRFEPWLSDALQRRVADLQADGYRKITREAIITEAVIQYLGMKRPAN